MSAEKGRCEDMAKADKACYGREMKPIPPKGDTKKKFKCPSAPSRSPLAFVLFYSEYFPKIKGEHLACPLVMPPSSWERCGVTRLQRTSSWTKGRWRPR